MSMGARFINGFGSASVVFSVSTLIISIVAIVISIYVARLPYRKRIVFSECTYVSEENNGIYFIATNAGNRIVRIRTIGIEFGGGTGIIINYLLDEKGILVPGDVDVQYYEVDSLIELIREEALTPSTPVTAVLEDTEGKIYRKKLMTVGDITLQSELFRNKWQVKR